jgi:hypothetical protein
MFVQEHFAANWTNGDKKGRSHYRNEKVSLHIQLKKLSTG